MQEKKSSIADFAEALAAKQLKAEGAEISREEPVDQDYRFCEPEPMEEPEVKQKKPRAFNKRMSATERLLFQKEQREAKRKELLANRPTHIGYGYRW